MRDINKTTAAYPEDKTLHQLFDQQATKSHDAIAVVYKDKQFTYGGLNEETNRLAHLLRMRGVTADTIVGVILAPGFEIPLALLSVLKAGGAYLPIDPGISGEHNPIFVNRQQGRDPGNQPGKYCSRTNQY